MSLSPSYAVILAGGACLLVSDFGGHGAWSRYGSLGFPNRGISLGGNTRPSLKARHLFN